MADSRGSVLHPQARTVMGRFTGLPRTSLVLLRSSPAPFHTAVGPLSAPQYFETVATYVALVSALSRVAIVSFLEVAGGMAQPYSFTDKLGTTRFLVRVFGFLGILPLLLAPFTRGGAFVVFATEVVLLSLSFLGRRIPVPDPRAH